MTEPSTMTPRERVKNAIDFKKVDTIPWVEVFFDETIIKFFSEGLPPNEMITMEWDVNPFFFQNWPRVIGFDPYAYFGCLNFWGCPIPIDMGPLPRFKQRKTGEYGRYEEYIMGTGARARRFKKGIGESQWYTMPLFTEFPVKDKNSWQQYKSRLNPDDPRRYPKDWEKDSYLQVLEEYQSGPTTLGITGFYAFGAEFMGIPEFNLAFYKNPLLIEEIASYWEYFTIESTRDMVETCKDRIDLICFWEDMASKHGPNISPKLYKKFLLPHYKKVTTFFKKNKITRIFMDSDGNTKPIIDLVIDSGINGHWPLEVNSGMDLRDLRRKYGKKLSLLGGLDKREIAKGGEAMRKEIDSKLPLMKETGGYIAGLDHLVHVEFTFEKFKEYVDYLTEQLIIE